MTDDPWHDNPGDGVCPVPPGTPIMVRFRDGEEINCEAPEALRWTFSINGWTRPYDIMKWRPKNAGDKL